MRLSGDVEVRLGDTWAVLLRAKAHELVVRFASGGMRQALSLTHGALLPNNHPLAQQEQQVVNAGGVAAAGVAAGGRAGESGSGGDAGSDLSGLLARAQALMDRSAEGPSGPGAATVQAL